jgi:serine phosphatase RsbU (regulator of sigma subunit)/tetratricopeptide (TPR) repeat protein
MTGTLNIKKFYLPYAILCMVCLICLVPLSGQSTGTSISDTPDQDSSVSVNLLEQAKMRFEDDSLDLALDLADEALQSAMKFEQGKIEIEALLLIADIKNRQDRAGEAIPYYLRITDIYESTGDTMALPDIYSRIANNYHAEGVFEKEGEYYLNAFHLSSSEEMKNRTYYLEKTGIACLRAGLTDSSIVHFTHLRSLLNEMGEDDRQVMNYIVQAHNKAGRHEEALEFNGLLFEEYRDELDYRQMSALKNNMAYNLTMMKDYESAALSYQEAIDYGRQAGIADKDLAILMTNAGICYQNMGEAKQSKPYFRMALPALKESGDMSEKSRVENILALIYYNEGDLYNAGLFSSNSIESAKLSNAPQRLSEGYLTYSRILREGNDPILALEYYENYLNIRDSLEIESKLNEQALAQKKEQLEKSERELILKLKEERVKDLEINQLKLQLEREEQEKELIRQENDMRLLEQARLEQDLVIIRQQNAADRQEREKERLEQEQKLTEMELEQELIKQREQKQEILILEREQEYDRLALDNEKTARKALTWISVLGVLMTILIAGSLISTRKKNVLLGKQKSEIEEKNTDLEQKNEEISSQRDEIEAQRDMLSGQKEEIEHNNKEILKSLEYASKIQSSTLPDLEFLNSVVSDHFLFFKPRDIVSGDFFWTATVEDSTVLTVADCTGHGVPGAFMSMLGMSLLKEIVLKEYITHPAVILRRLRKEVISALGQKGLSGEQGDGMDMALITISHDARKLEFAGAYNPLYLVRRKELPPPSAGEIFITDDERKKSDYILYEIPADKMPISHFLKMDKFRSQELEIFEGDNIYLFSDGYPDQFGGPRGKKFKYKPFKYMLLDNANLTMEKQHKVLEDTLDSWKGSHDQVDDICIIGLKI